MKKIELSQEDFEFLKELQHELNTQDTDGQAEPRYWMVMEKETMATPPGVGQAYIYLGDGDVRTHEETVQFIKENMQWCDNEAKKKWKSVNKKDFDEVLEYLKETFNCGEEVWQDERDRISHFSGAFLTKRECKRHIETNRHHYDRPCTFAMTAYRNYELERLLKILQTMKMED